MAITLTNAHRVRMIQEASVAVLQLQDAVHSNAQQHKLWAQNQTVSLAELQQRIADTLNAYERNVRAPLRNFRDVTVANDPAFLTVGDSMQLTLQSVGSVGAEVADAIDVFTQMPLTTYAEIIVACDYLISAVDPVPKVF